MIVGILIFDQVEVLDVTGPFEVFSVTRLNENRRREESSPFESIRSLQSVDLYLHLIRRSTTAQI